jgi:hypothetical protein
MTIYTLDLLELTSLSRLPTTQDITELCLQVCKGILRKLYVAIKDGNPSDHDTIANYNILIQRYLGILGRASSDNVSSPYPMDILCICATRHLNRDVHPIPEVLANGTVEKVYFAFLVELMNEVLKNTLACVKHRIPSFPNTLINECNETFQEIYRGLLEIFPESPNTPPNYAKAIVQVEVQDLRDESHDYI